MHLVQLMRVCQSVLAHIPERCRFAFDVTFAASHATVDDQCKLMRKSDDRSLGSTPKLVSRKARPQSTFA